jgi:hypothetical protein
MPDELQQPLVLNPFGDLTHQFVVIDSIEEFLQIKINGEFPGSVRDAG